MADHRIRLTDRELALSRAAAEAMYWALYPGNPILSAQYRSLGDRLQHTKAGGQPVAVRAARKHFKTEAPIA
jgi:hypothetical protein